MCHGPEPPTGSYALDLALRRRAPSPASERSQFHLAGPQVRRRALLPALVRCRRLPARQDRLEQNPGDALELAASRGRTAAATERAIHGVEVSRLKAGQLEVRRGSETEQLCPCSYLPGESTKANARQIERSRNCGRKASFPQTEFRAACLTERHDDLANGFGPRNALSAGLRASTVKGLTCHDWARTSSRYKLGGRRSGRAVIRSP
jgi:hypothetical protein